MKASFNELSIDVLRHLLETTALDDRKTALTLVLLSKAVREWIDPIIYRRAVLTMENILQFERTIRVRNDVAFFARNVRVLSLAITRSPEYAQAAAHILSICTGIKSVAWQSFSASFPPMNSISPTHICIVEPSSDDMALLPPSVTHLALSAETFKDAETLTVMDVDFDGLFPAHFIHYVLSELASDVKYLIVVFPPTPRGLTWPFARFISQLKDARFVPVCLEARYHRDAIPGLACYAHDHNVFDDWGYRLARTTMCGRLQRNSQESGRRLDSWILCLTMGPSANRVSPPQTFSTALQR
ncbi:hypothetical protein BDZ89DRAFT_807685 [Hymenopellis radicata]|nr:hypothetical protein BDZ89DRAFT_807685 [Hymenopellis radicata]